MKKVPVISCAAVLVVLLGGFLIWRSQTRSQPLAEVISLTGWTLVNAQEWTDIGITGPVIKVNPTELSDLLETATVKKTSKEGSLPVPCLLFFVQSKNQETFELVIGANGKVTYAMIGDLTNTRTYWELMDTTLYQKLLLKLQF